MPESRFALLLSWLMVVMPATAFAQFGPVLTITSKHTGPFRQGQQASFSLLVSNIGNGPTSGTVTVTDSPGSWMTLESASGAGWTCAADLNTCTRNDSLPVGASYPLIIVQVRVARDAPSPLANQVAVSGGRAATALGADRTQVNGTCLTTSSLLEGPTGGTSSVILRVTPGDAKWTAQSNDHWLHLMSGSASGTGNAIVEFSFDQNLDPAVRIGTLTIAGQTLRLTQAGSDHAPVSVKSTLASSGLSGPRAIAVDAAGSVYIADTGNSAIRKWDSQTQKTITLASTGIQSPEGVAVDWQGNVYFADTHNNAVKVWNSLTAQVDTLVSAGLDWPTGLTLDPEGNLYIADTYNGAIKKWSATDHSVTTVVSGLSFPDSVALDPLGNLYTGGISPRFWNASTQQLTTTASGLPHPASLASDGQRNLFIADTENNAIRKLSFGYLSLAWPARTENSGATTDSLPFDVLPVDLPVSATSDQPWLTVTGAGNGAVAFSLAANTSGAARTAHISVLGVTATVVQMAVAAPVLTSPATSARSLLAEHPRLAGGPVAVPHTGPAVAGTGFAPGVHYAAGDNSAAVAIGDFNGDGKPDLAVANKSSGDVTVLLGNGDGTFHWFVNVNAGSLPSYIATGDFNGDGKLDLAVGGGTAATVTILLGNGDGSFRAGANLTTSQAFGRGLTVADIDGDGKADIVVSAASVGAFLGNGDGTFQAYKEIYPSAQYSWGGGVAVGDMNGDGIPDIVFGAENSSGPGYVGVQLGLGKGSFATAHTYTLGTNPKGVAIADFSGDGHADVAVIDSRDDSISILLGNGDGTLQPPILYYGIHTPASITATDLNADGKPDLLIANAGSNDISVLLGNGNGTFQPANFYHLGGPGEWAAVADFNGDGRLDVATADGSGVTVLLATGRVVTTASLAVSPSAPVLSQQVTLSATATPADATGTATFYDGSVILGSVPLTNGQAVFTTTRLSPGQHSLQAFYAGDSAHTPARSAMVARTISALSSPGFAAPRILTVGTKPLALIAADFNKDGYTDLAAADHDSNQVTVLLGGAGGAFQPAVNYPSPNTPQAIAAGDLTGDGVIDLLAGNSVGFSALTGNGDGTFSTGNSYPSLGSIYSLAIMDLDRNGTSDIAATAASGSFWISTASGSWSGNYYPQSGLTMGDLNADGVADAVLISSGDGTITTLLGNGNGSFRQGHTYSVGATPTAAVLADVNGDGKPDVIVSNSGTNNVAVLFGNGDGTLQQAAFYAAGPGPAAVVAADLNGDGIVDLAVANKSSNTVSILYGNSGGTFQAPTNLVVGAGPASLVVADFNHDGRSDLAIANSGDGTVATLLSLSAATLQITLSHHGSFTEGQNGAVYTITVTNAAGATATNGRITVTETVPSGMTLISMTGTGWNCPGDGTCSQDATLQPGASFLPIGVTVNVVNGTQGQILTNQAKVSGGGSPDFVASDPTTIVPYNFSACDLNGDRTMDSRDVLAALADILTGSLAGDLNHDGFVNVLDTQIVIRAASNLGCMASQ